MTTVATASFVIKKLGVIMVERFKFYNIVEIESIRKQQNSMIEHKLS